MKHFLVLLFSATIFCAYSQTVTIPVEAAKWYLEQADRVPLLEAQVDIKDQAIKNFEHRLKVHQALLKTYEEDNQTYREIIAANNGRIDLLEKDKEVLKKEVKRQRTQKLVVGGAGAGAIVGSFVGQPLIGAGVGAGVGYVVGVFKKK